MSPTETPTPGGRPLIRAELIDPRVSRELRRSVLRPEQDPHDPLPGDDQLDAVHIGAFTPDRWLASTCFVFPEPCPWTPEPPAWHLRAMATDPRFWGLGAGAAVLQTAVDYVSAVGGELLWCDARETALGFYEKAGWSIHGERHLSGPMPLPHFYMWRPVPAPVPTAPDDL